MKKIIVLWDVWTVVVCSPLWLGSYMLVLERSGSFLKCSQKGQEFL